MEPRINMNQPLTNHSPLLITINLYHPLLHSLTIINKQLPRAIINQYHQPQTRPTNHDFFTKPHPFTSRLNDPPGPWALGPPCPRHERGPGGVRAPAPGGIPWPGEAFPAAGGLLRAVRRRDVGGATGRGPGEAQKWELGAEALLMCGLYWVTI